MFIFRGGNNPPLTSAFEKGKKPPGAQWLSFQTIRSYSAAACLILLSAACNNSAAPPEVSETPARAEPSVAAPQRQSQTLEREETDAGLELVFPTTLMVENDVEIKTRLTGVVEQIFVDRGLRVRKGDPLARLRNNDLALEVQMAEASRRQSEVELERAKSLYEQKLLSDSDYDAKKMNYENAVSRHQLSKVNYEQSILRAPFDGVIIERYAKVGQRVVEDESAALFRIASMQPLVARLYVPEEQLARLSLKMKAEFVPMVAPTRSFNGRIKWISSVVDASSGTGTVLVELDSISGPPRVIFLRAGVRYTTSRYVGTSKIPGF